MQRATRHDIRSALSPALGFTQLAEDSADLDSAVRFSGRAKDALVACHESLDDVTVVKASGVTRPGNFTLRDLVDATERIGVHVEVDAASLDVVCSSASAFYAMVVHLGDSHGVDRVEVEVSSRGYELVVDLTTPDASPEMYIGLGHSIGLATVASGPLTRFAAAVAVADD